MSNTPGVVVPDSYSSNKELVADVLRRSRDAGYTPFDEVILEHSGMETVMEVDDFFEHHGVKGMHWGTRKNDHPDVSRKTNREASKDASEHARAKLFYGEGAGTRRKLIKATVEAKSKKDPNYAKAFDHHLSRQDLSKHAEAARSERSSKDHRKVAKQGAGQLARRFTGEMGNNAAFVAAGTAGVAFLASPKGRSAMSKTAKTARSFADKVGKSNAEKFVADYLKNKL